MPIIQRFIQERNEEAHHRNRGQAGAFQRRSAMADLAQDLDTLLGKLEFLAGYPLLYVEHAEHAAIYEAARIGTPTEGATLICPWAACADCARAIMFSGIAQLVVHKQALARTPDRWLDEVQSALDMIEAAGVKIIRFDGHIGCAPLRHSGEEWYP